MVTLVKTIYQSNGWLLIASALAIPILVFSGFRSHLNTRRGAWALLAMVLLLSLSVSGIEDLAARMGGFDAAPDWADLLSLGEQQRLAFARLLIHQPRFAVLDEATSALDRKNEAHLYGLLKQKEIHYISVGHRQPLLDYHDRVVELQGEEKWRIVPAMDYRKMVAAT